MTELNNILDHFSTPRKDIACPVCGEEFSDCGHGWDEISEYIDALRKQLDIAVKQLQRIRDSSLTKASIPYHLAYTALAEIERIGGEK
jgi:hypothetical protein